MEWTGEMDEDEQSLIGLNGRAVKMTDGWLSLWALLGKSGGDVGGQ